MCMQLNLTAEQIKLVEDLKKLHYSHIDFITPAETKALETLMAGRGLQIDMLPRLTDFFGRLVDYDITDLVDASVKQFIISTLEWAIKAFRDEVFG